MTPTASPSVQTLTSSTNPHLGALHMGRTHEAGMPADQRYLSGD
jgi:hypothetical protein